MMTVGMAKVAKDAGDNYRRPSRPHVLAVHAHAGGKDRVHRHYLRGTIFCGGCGRRLIFSRATGRHGGTFDYFICPKRRNEDVHCARRSIRVERIEDGVLALYQRLELPAETVHSIRLGVHAEMAGESVEAHRQAERSNHSLKKLGQERAALMRARYEGAVPLDLLKTEMERLTRPWQRPSDRLKPAASIWSKLKPCWNRPWRSRASATSCTDGLRTSSGGR